MSGISRNVWLTVTEAAERLLVEPRTVRRWIEEGEFPNAVKTRQFRGHYRIPESDIVAFENSRKVK